MTKSATKLVVSGSALQAVQFAIAVVVAFFLTPFVIHSLGDRMYGFWTLAAAFVGYYGLMDLGLSSAVNRYIAGAAGKRDREEYAGVFSTALQLYSVLGAAVLALSVAVAFLAPFFAHSAQDAALFRDVILIMGTGLALSFPARAYGGLLGAELRIGAVAVIGIVVLLLRAGLVVLVLLAGYKLMALAWVTFISGLPTIAAYVWLARRECPWLRFRRQPWLGQWTKTLFSYSSFAFLGNLTNEVRFNVDSFVITAFVGLAAVTHFRIAGLMASYFMALIASLVGAMQPWFSRMEGAGDYGSIQRTLLFSTKLSVCAAAFVGFGLIAWGRPFIVRWMGPAYLDAYPCLVVLALGYIVWLAQYPSITLMYGMAKHKGLVLINTVESFSNLALSVWFAKSMGIFGVALGTFIPMAFVVLVVQPLYFCRVSPVPYGRYMSGFGRAMAAAAVALVVPGIVTAIFAAPDYYRLALVALASSVAYAVAVTFLQFSREEREMLRRILLPTHQQAGLVAALSEGDAR